MTRRFLVILAVGLLCGLASSWIAYRSCCDRPLVTDAASGDVRAWFRAEFGLDEATIDAIQQSQERFRPECEIHCRDIRDARVALMTLPPDAPEFACTVLMSRRLYPEAPSRKLSALGQWLGLRRDGRAHRALSDALLTAHLLARIQADVCERFAAPLAGRPADHALLCRLQRAPKERLERAVAPPGLTPLTP